MFLGFLKYKHIQFLIITIILLIFYLLDPIQFWKFNIVPYDDGNGFPESAIKNFFDLRYLQYLSIFYEKLHLPADQFYNFRPVFDIGGATDPTGVVLNYPRLWVIFAKFSNIQKNSIKFSFFVEVALQTLKKLYWVPDFIVCNNWQTSITPLLLKEKIKNDPLLKDVKVVFFIHEIDSNYNFSNNLLKKLNIQINNKDASQNMLSLASKHADLTYVVNNGKNEKEIKTLLKQNEYKNIEPVDSLKTTEKIDLYNMLSTDMHSLV